MADECTEVCDDLWTREWTTDGNGCNDCDENADTIELCEDVGTKPRHWPCNYAATCAHGVKNLLIHPECRNCRSRCACPDICNLACSAIRICIISRIMYDWGLPARSSAGEEIVINLLCMTTMCVTKKSRRCVAAMLAKAQGAGVLILSIIINLMHADEQMRYGIRYGLHRKRFGREGVFNSEYSHLSQSYNMLCIDRMCMSAYTCIDIHNLMHTNAYRCTDTNCMHSALIWLKCYKRLKTI